MELTLERSSIAGPFWGVVAIGVEGLVISPVLSDISRDFNVDAAQTAFVVAVYGLTIAVTAPLVGLWGARFSRKTVMCVGLVTFVVAGLLSATASSFTSLVSARALCGMAAGAFLPSCYAYVGDCTPYAQRGRVMGRVMAGWSLALIFGVPLGSAVGEVWGWRATFVGVSALGVVAAWLVSSLPAVGHSDATGHSVVEDAMAALRTSASCLLLVNFLDMASFYGVYTFLGSVVRSSAGVGSSVFGMLVLCYGLGLLAGTMNARLLDQWGKKQVATWTLALLAFVFTALPVVVGSTWLLATCMLIWGGLQGLTQTAMATLLTQVKGSTRSFMTACMSCTTYLAVAIGAALGGMLLEKYGFATLSWSGAICVLLSSLILHRVAG
jgi:MFS transporter, DHA1 family, inner membrane transport protein